MTCSDTAVLYIVAKEEENMKDTFGREIVRKTTGQIVGFIEHKPERDIVCEPTGPMKGFCQNGGTFDKIGRRLLTSEQPGFLLGKRRQP